MDEGIRMRTVIHKAEHRENLIICPQPQAGDRYKETAPIIDREVECPGRPKGYVCGVKVCSNKGTAVGASLHSRKGKVKIYESK